MKFYIVNSTNYNPLTTENGYLLISEKGQLISGCMSINKYIAKISLLKNSINDCKRIAKNSIVEILYLGDDNMTEQELKLRNKENLIKEAQDLIRQYA